MWLSTSDSEPNKAFPLDSQGVDVTWKYKWHVGMTSIAGICGHGARRRRWAWRLFVGGRNAKKRLLNILCTSLDIWAGIWCESVEWERLANGLVMGCSRKDGNVEADMFSWGGVGDCILGAAYVHIIQTGVAICSYFATNWRKKDFFYCVGANLVSSGGSSILLSSFRK